MATGARERVPAVVATVAAAAWVVTVAAQTAGRTEPFHHDHLADHGVAAPVAVGLFVVSWQVMLAAMMLPSSLGMVRAFGRLSRAQTHPAAAQSAFIAAYLAVWTVFGLIAFGGDVALHHAVEDWPWLNDHPWLIAGAVLVGAGAFQFTALKDRCLAECRTPVGFLVQRYRPGARAALRIGVDHATFCIGCCWALMLVAFAVGAGNLLWMGALATAMALERTVSWGAAVVRPVGALLVLLGLTVAVHPAGFPALLGPG
jgi:predicted metal-binding membrane protein